MDESEKIINNRDFGFFNSEEISDDEMEVDDNEKIDNETNENENKIKKDEKEKIKQKNKKKIITKISVPTISEIESDVITKLANVNWNNTNKNEVLKYDPKVISVIWNELKNDNFSLKKIMLLEFNQYLEKYLLPFYKEDVDDIYILSIVIIINEKFRQKVSDIWDIFNTAQEKFQSIFYKILNLLISPLTDEDNKNIIDLQIRRYLLIFLINCFQSLENPTIRLECMKIVSLPIWHNITPLIREENFKIYPQFKKLWNRMEKKYKKSDDKAKEKIVFQRMFFLKMFKIFLKVLNSIPLSDQSPPNSIAYCERFIELLIDLETQLPTRRYFNVFLNDHHIIPICYSSNLAQRGLMAQQNNKNIQKSLSNNWNNETENPILFIQLLDILKFYSHFEINDFTGYSLNDADMIKMHYSKIKKLQLVAFSKFKDELEDLALSNVKKIEDRNVLKKYIEKLDDETIYRLCTELGIRTKTFLSDSDNENFSCDLLKEIIVLKYQKRPSQVEMINEMPLYPDEEVIFDESIVPATPYFLNTHCIAIPKLNLQFLTLHDYLLRNFNLFRLESAFEIRQDIEDVVKRLGVLYDQDQQRTVFSGWSRMGVEIKSFNIIEIGPPKLGENKPSFIKADVEIDTQRFTPSIRKEWDSLRPHDILFLLDVHAKAQLPGWVEFQKQNEKEEVIENSGQKFRKDFGLGYVRGCEILALLGEDGKPIDEFVPYVTPTKSTGEARTVRSIRVLLDPNQYKTDMNNLNSGKIDSDVYNSFTILMRRKPKENNFKAILETIRDLMQSELVVPKWLHEIFLGYGNPNGAEYTKIMKTIRTIDYCDTFLDWKHVTESYSKMKILTLLEKGKLENKAIDPPYVITYPKDMFEKNAEFSISKNLNKRKLPIEYIEEEIEQESDSIIVQTYKEKNKGPYLEDKSKKNCIRFTPTQIEAIHSGSSPGLTMIVGPPGTGKTDVAVQIISNIYHNNPEQHTLLVTHSNQALNQLFEKIVELDIDPCHLLRLGHGEEELNIEGAGSWGKYGRVNSYLEKRIELLEKVDKLAKSLNIPGEHGYTCETASYFYQYHILNTWESYYHNLKVIAKQDKRSQLDVVEDFPFKKFFDDVPTPLFPENGTFESAMEIAEGCFYHIKKIFKQLEEIRAFELLRTNSDRANYLLIKEAKIVTMTCTHAALKRRELVALGFKYDNVIMEESAQILEVETFIPLLLQSSDDGESRLKRVVLIGDHHQLPPVVKSMAFQRYGNMEQSLFTRFIRLGVPYIELDKQARARSSIAELYKWKYRQLGDLDMVLQSEEFKYANPGFAYEYQFINVVNSKESEPIPYFYQNVLEAEMVVATYQYMRLLGYPSEKITILTTYNGQKQLIRDVLRQRCSWNPIFGKPHKVTTVDKYQGQQNDYILLSLVRTKNVGHLRDPRRLIVAMSRARLGLYVFGCQKLFSNCYELEPTFKIFLKRPTLLVVHSNEMYNMLPNVNSNDSTTTTITTTTSENGNTTNKTTKEFRTFNCYDTKYTAQGRINTIKNKTFIIENTEHMGQYIYQMTQEHLEYIKKLKFEEEKNKEEIIQMKENRENAIKEEEERLKQSKIENEEKKEISKKIDEKNDVKEEKEKTEDDNKMDQD